MKADKHCWPPILPTTPLSSAVLLLMAILVVYMVLGIRYESFIHPFTILSALPFAGFGAQVTLLFFRVE